MVRSVENRFRGVGIPRAYPPTHSRNTTANEWGTLKISLSLRAYLPIKIVAWATRQVKPVADCFPLRYLSPAFEKWPAEHL